MNLAPNGRRSNLNAQQYDLVRTIAFKKWFGDWENDPQNASKVVDENGEPMVCYHGSDKKISIFNKKKSAQGVFWFSSNKEKIEKGESGAAYINVILPVFLSCKKIAGWKEYERHGLGEIKQMGFDAIQLYDDFVVYEPNQIKLANGKNTTFDSTNKNIRFAEGGKMGKSDIKILVENLMAKIEKQYEVDLFIYYSKFSDSITLSKIVVSPKKRNEGIGSKIMTEICSFADNHNVRIFLTPSVDFGGAKNRLIKFYKGFGFMKYKGYEARESFVRIPNKEKDKKKKVNLQYADGGNIVKGFNYSIGGL